MNRALFKVTKFNNTCARSTDLDRTLYRDLATSSVANLAHQSFCFDSVSTGTIGTNSEKALDTYGIVQSV